MDYIRAENKLQSISYSYTAGKSFKTNHNLMIYFHFETGCRETFPLRDTCIKQQRKTGPTRVILGLGGLRTWMLIIYFSGSSYVLR